MATTVIYHNPRCTKSRLTLELLQTKGEAPQVIEYLQTPPTADELDAVLRALGAGPEAITRTGESRYEELGLKNKKLTRAEHIRILVENPILIERPIVVKNGKAAIGRPPENVLKIL